MKGLILILLLCFCGQISWATGLLSGEDWLNVETYPGKAHEEVTAGVPLLPQRRPIPKVGESFQLTCGFDLSKIDHLNIKRLNWYRSTEAKQMVLIPEDPTQRISVRFDHNYGEYKKVLTVKNVRESDDGVSFLCFALTEINGVERWQKLELQLEVFGARLLKVETFDGGDEATTGASLLPQRRPTPKLGESFEVTCGYDLFKINPRSIKRMNWYISDGASPLEHLPEDPTQRISVRFDHNYREYKKVLTVRNVKRSDHGKVFICYVLTEVDNVYRWRALTLNLNVVGLQ